MGGFSWLARRPAAAGDPTHALFAAQSHSIVDNLLTLFEHSRAWNCSYQQRALATGRCNGLASAARRSRLTSMPIETTIAVYCGMEQMAAFARFDEIVSAYLVEKDEDASE